MQDIPQDGIISIHTPHAGSDWSCTPRLCLPAYFNPHSPCGERQQNCTKSRTILQLVLSNICSILLKVLYILIKQHFNLVNLELIDVCKIESVVFLQAANNLVRYIPFITSHSSPGRELRLTV